MLFEEIFSPDKKRLDGVIDENDFEKNHFRRCLALAGSIDWSRGQAGGEFGTFLNPKGLLALNQIIRRIKYHLAAENAAELRDPEEIIRNLMLVHDLGKYNAATNQFDGSDHEERSADLVAGKKEILVRALHWQPESVSLFIHLVRYHGSLGIVRIGEASIVFLLPLLHFLSNLAPERKRLFLDLLILITCCDAGASGDFQANRFYLDHSRIAFYLRLSANLLALSDFNVNNPHLDRFSILLKRASGLPATRLRIKGMVSSGNRLKVADTVIDSTLREARWQGDFDSTCFALTRFDHGAYVFEPLLFQIGRGDQHISQKPLSKLLLFIGLLCKGARTLRVVHFRDSFSMKTDFRSANQSDFDKLCSAIEQEDPIAITKILTEHKLTSLPDGNLVQWFINTLTYFMQQAGVSRPV